MSMSEIAAMAQSSPSLDRQQAIGATDIPTGVVHSLAGKGIHTVGALLDTDAFKTITSGRYDIDSVKEVNGIPILHSTELEEYLYAHSVDVVALTVPQSIAQSTATRLLELGVRGFWNFTNVELVSSRPDVKFENIHFADSLLTLCYRISNP